MCGHKQNLLPIYTQYSSDGFSAHTQYEKDDSVWKWRLSAHTQYAHNDPYPNPIGPIKIILVPGWPNDQTYSF